MTYVPVKTHNIADALSRAPIFPGTDELDIQVDTVLAYLAATRDPALDIVHESIDPDYQQCMEDIIEDTVTSHRACRAKETLTLANQLFFWHGM